MKNFPTYAVLSPMYHHPAKIRDARRLPSVCKTSPRHARLQSRDGVTFIELLIALSIMALIAVAMGSISIAVQMSSQYSLSHGMATQHARIALQRMEWAVCGAEANEQFPGFTIFTETINSTWTFPDTLVVWQPSGAAADEEGLPRFDELVIFCPDPDHPNVLLEIRATGDTRTVPSLSETALWATEIATIKNSNTANRVTLTDLMRSENVSGGNDTSERGAIRFIQRLRPSKKVWNKYQSDTADWEDLAWVQGIYGSSTGLRQSWLQIELQLVSKTSGGINKAGTTETIPFFGSAALYYEMNK